MMPLEKAEFTGCWKQCWWSVMWVKSECIWPLVHYSESRQLYYKKSWLYITCIRKFMMILLLVHLACATLHHDFNSGSRGIDRAHTVLYMARKCTEQPKFAAKNTRICAVLTRRSFLKHFCAKCELGNAFHHDKLMTTMRETVFGIRSPPQTVPHYY